MKRLLILTILLVALMGFTVVHADEDVPLMLLGVDLDGDSLFDAVDIKSTSEYSLVISVNWKYKYEIRKTPIEKAQGISPIYIDCYVTDLNTDDKYKELIIRYGSWGDDSQSNQYIYILRYNGKELKVIAEHYFNIFSAGFKIDANRSNIVYIAEPLVDLVKEDDKHNLFELGLVWQAYKIKNKRLVKVKELTNFIDEQRTLIADTVLYEKPDLNGSILTTTKNNKTVKLLKITADRQWLYVKYGKQYGYINIYKTDINDLFKQTAWAW